MNYANELMNHSSLKKTVWTDSWKWIKPTNSNTAFAMEI